MRLLLGIFMVACLTACAGVAPDKAKQVFDTQARAEAWYQQGQYSKALPEYQSLVADLPESKHSWLRLGNCYAQLGDYNLAVGAYQMAISLDPEFASAWINMSYVQSQILTQTVADMYANVPKNDPQIVRVQRLVDAVLEPFNTLDAGEQTVPESQESAGSVEVGELREQ
ncbi:tetratricopeptide repeat protein [Gilvimarinus sp. SDUM040013]|uniref:Tetratricopeptide repeat protein n=1 Tax=Gilvimarinus gilvus TaxID=3058038 RepID=A0ABU4RXV8_9GAMM|nr:tetratricopeptide repeat protein [Gilvimarinus sp. SDUM040013]MDO3386260.1 tetratricopeptide repeat protein [Gilvimarinus sp. SDUM040013]MDX6849745.1 tetratricopeptide repeat protein [Gilvimarinus sp. SDUM040013]